MVMAISDCFIIGALLSGVAFILALFLHDEKKPKVAASSPELAEIRQNYLNSFASKEGEERNYECLRKS